MAIHKLSFGSFDFMNFVRLEKLKKGDKIAIVSPSFAAPAQWPHIYDLCLRRMREIFELEPIEFPYTKNLGATGDQRASDLIAAFENPEIKAVMASLGGDDQVTYIKNLPSKPFIKNPKPFFGFSDNTHFINHLWLNNIPAYYGSSLFTEFGIQGEMDLFTIDYLKRAFFEEGEFELTSSETFNDIGLDWSNPETLTMRRRYQPNDGLYWDGTKSTEGILWGGCLESLDEILRHNIKIPTIQDFQNIVLAIETSEEIPSSDYVMRVLRAFGERGILNNLKGLIVGRPKAWEFDKQNSDEEKIAYKKAQRQIVLTTVRKYNPHMPIIQNLDFGHTAPQIPLPFGRRIRLNSNNQKIYAEF
jgi:muramoyltetrapeptide carboxypeptidase LdcA involved in peptidoglycan recycling